ncbi:MAG TPA: hypothetical protein PLR20_13830 [Syntrophales bacterium]|nr:hypothetical protein [Syntrophales bacterium]HPN26246.1 hypothetical protein [Syntrophales bacterium]HQM30424.1 hypothetical protein [Syntrophales bacterium]
MKFRNFHHIFFPVALNRDKLIERLKETGDPDERNRILEALSAHDLKETPSGIGSSGAFSGREKALSALILGYVVGACFLIGGFLMVYTGIGALSEGSKPGRVVTLFIVGGVLLVLGMLAAFRAGRTGKAQLSPPFEVDKKDIFRMEP